METEFPVASNEPFLGSETPVRLDLGRDRSRASGFFRWIPYKAIGQFTGTLDYALIVTASIVAGAGYHALILRGDVPDLMPYLAAGNLVAALFVFGLHVPGQLQPERHRLGTPPSTIRRTLLVVSVSELGSVPVSGQVRRRFFTRHGDHFRLVGIRRCCSGPMFGFPPLSRTPWREERSRAIGPSPSAIATR